MKQPLSPTTGCYDNDDDDLSVLALTVDRLLAIHFHLRYQDVTYKRSFAAVISLFMISASLSCVGFWVTHASTILTVFEIIVCLTITLILSCRIYSVVRRHRSQINAQQVRQETAEYGEENLNAERGFITEKLILRVPHLCHLLFTSDAYQCNLS